MKKVFLGLLITFIITTAFSACASQKELQKWDCSVTLAANFAQIVKSDTLVKIETGELSLQNPTDIDLTWYLFDTTEPESTPRDLVVKAGGIGTMYQLKNNTDYCVGIAGHTDTDLFVKIIISDGPNPDPY